MILSYAIKVHAELAKRLYLKISHAAVVELSSKLLSLVVLSRHRATFRAVDRKHAVIPKSLTTVMKKTRNVPNARS